MPLLPHVVGPLTWGRSVQSCPQAPQLAGCERSVVHPAPAPEQSAKPAAHVYVHLPAAHAIPVLLTCASAVQSLSHAPHV